MNPTFMPSACVLHVDGIFGAREVYERCMRNALQSYSESHDGFSVNHTSVIG